jgi:anthranilate phosphoribosyltransferase
MLKPYIARVIKGTDLTYEEAETAMSIVMRGDATEAQIGGYLVALRMKGETVDEIAGSAAAMRSVVNRVEIPAAGTGLVDTAGTGGDGSHSFNISTAAAFVIAGAGRRVAKHGNRAASSRCGSADVLAALGVEISLTPEQVGDCIREIGIGFMFAPKFHPAMRHAIGPRVELGQRTIFNILGPLTNPAGATHQLLGVFDPALTEPMARVLGDLGGVAAFVVHGAGGLDELTTGGLNRVSRLSDGNVETFELDPAGLGLQPARVEDLAGGEPEENAALMRDLLSGRTGGPLADVVALNAGAALSLDDGDLASGIARAHDSLRSGAAAGKLNALVEFTRAFAG